MSVNPPSLTQLVPRDKSLVAYWTLGDNAADVFSGSLFCVKKSDGSVSANIYLTKYQCNELSYPIIGLENGTEYTVELSLVYNSATSDEVFVAPMSATPVPKVDAPRIIGNTAIVFSGEDVNGNVVVNVKYDVGLTVEFTKPLKNFTPQIEKVYFKFVDTDNSSIRHESRSVNNTLNADSRQLTFNFDDIFDSIHKVYVYAVDSNGPSDLSEPYTLTIGKEPNIVTIDAIQTMIAGDVIDNLPINDIIPDVTDPDYSPYLSGTIVFTASTNQNNSIIDNKSSEITGIIVAYSYDEITWDTKEIDLDAIENVTINGQTISMNNIILDNLLLNYVVSIKVAGVNANTVGSYGEIIKCSVIKNSLFDSELSLNSCDINDHINITGSVKLGSMPHVIHDVINNHNVPVTYIHLDFTGYLVNESYDIPLTTVTNNLLQYNTGDSVPFTITELQLSSNMDLSKLKELKSLNVTANIFEIVQVPSSNIQPLNISEFIKGSLTLGEFSEYKIFTNTADRYIKSSSVTAFDTPLAPTLVEIDNIGDKVITIDVTIPDDSSDYNLPSYLAVVISTSTFDESTGNLIPALMYDINTNPSRIAQLQKLNKVQDLPVGNNLFADSQFQYLPVNVNISTKYSFQFDGLTNNVTYYVWTVTFNEQGFSPALKFGTLVPVDPVSYDNEPAVSLTIKPESLEDKNNRVLTQRALLTSDVTLKDQYESITIIGEAGAVTSGVTFPDLSKILTLVNNNNDNVTYKNTIVLSWPAFTQSGYTLMDYYFELFEDNVSVFSNTTASTLFEYTEAKLGKKYYFKIKPRIYITDLGQSTQSYGKQLTSKTLVSHKSSVIATPLFFSGTHDGSVVVGAMHHNGRSELNSKKTDILSVILPDAPTGTETINHLIDSTEYYTTSTNNPELSLYILKLDYHSVTNKLKLLYASDSYSYDLLDGLHS